MSEDQPDEAETDARLESTLESGIEDEQTHISTGKFRAASSRTSDSSKPPAAFETLPRSIPRAPSPRAPSTTPVPPEPLGLSGEPLAIGRSGVRSVPEPPRPKVPSSRPPALTGTPISVPPPRLPSPSAPPLGSSAAGSIPPPHATEAEIPSPRASVPDDAPTLPGTLKHLMDEDMDLAAESGPPGIPLILTPPEADASEERRRKNAARRKRQQQRKGKRPTVRIPDDHVGGTDVAASQTSVESGSGATGMLGEQEALDEQDEDEVLDELDGHDEPVDVDEAHGVGGPLGRSGDDEDLDEPTIESIEPEPTHRSAPAPKIEAVTVSQRDSFSNEPIPSARASAPVLADEQAIVLLRPIEVVSDMPPVPSASRPGLARPPEDEDFLEIEPERMSLPGDVMTAQRRSDLRPPPLPPTRTGSTAPAPPSSPSNVKGAPVAEARLAIPGPLPVPIAPPSNFAAVSEPPPPKSEDRPARSLPKPPPPPTEFTTGRPKEKRPWWVEMFDDDFVRTLDNPKLRDVERDVAFIEQSLRLPQGSRVLDLACGNGVHAVELAARGYHLTGLDLSTTMLDMARSYNGRRSQAVSFIQADMRQLELEATFDAVYSWGASFGYFEDATNVNIIERIVRALKPGGRFLIDLTNRDFVAPRSPSTAWFEKPGCVCMDEVRYDFLSSRLFAKRMVIFESGRAREIEYSVRLYTANELGILLESRGLRVTEISGHRSTRGAYFGNESPQIIILAEKV